MRSGCGCARSRCWGRGSACAQLGDLSTHHTREAVIVHGLAPFLAVYALGGFASEQVALLQQAGIVWLGPDYWANQPVRFDQWQLYLGMLAVAWVVLQAAAFVQRRRPNLVTALVQVLAKGTTVLAAFIVVTEVTRRLVLWLQGRAVAGWVQDGWAAFLAWLPDWRLPFDLTLPEALADAVDALVTTVLPGTIAMVVLPLTWLALTASVFGWRDLTTNPIGLTDTERLVLDRARQAGETRTGRRARDLVSSGPLRLAWSQLVGLTEDYLPLGQGVRIIARAGTAFVAAYLVAAAVWATAERALRWLARSVVSTRTLEAQITTDPLVDFLVSLVFVTGSMALYAVGFDRAILAAVAGPGHRAGEVTAAARTPAPADPAASSPHAG